MYWRYHIVNMKGTARDHTYFNDGHSLYEFLQNIAKAAESCADQLSKIDEDSEEYLHVHSYANETFRIHPPTSAMALKLKDKETGMDFWRWLYPKTLDEILIFDMAVSKEEFYDTVYQEMILFELNNTMAELRESKIAKYEEKILGVKNPVRLSYYAAGIIGSVLAQGASFIDIPLKSFEPKVPNNAYNRMMLELLTKLFKGKMTGEFTARIPKWYHSAVNAVMKYTDKIVTKFCEKTCAQSSIKDQLELIKCAVFSYYVRLLMMDVIRFAEYCSVIRANSYMPSVEELKAIIKPIDVTDVVGFVMPPDVPDWLDSALIAPPEVAKDYMRRKMEESSKEAEDVMPVYRKSIPVS